jgi:maltose/moltooligosaccharide transporter
MDKPPRTFWQIWNMSFGFLGIQFGWGLQMANMSSIYEYLGAGPIRSRFSGWPRPSPD